MLTEMNQTFTRIMEAAFVGGDTVVVDNPQSDLDGRLGKVDCVRDSIVHVRIDNKLHYIQTKYIILNGVHDNGTTRRTNEH